MIVLSSLHAILEFSIGRIPVKPEWFADLIGKLLMNGCIKALYISVAFLYSDDPEVKGGFVLGC